MISQGSGIIAEEEIDSVQELDGGRRQYGNIAFWTQLFSCTHELMVVGIAYTKPRHAKSDQISARVGVVGCTVLPLDV